MPPNLSNMDAAYQDFCSILKKAAKIIQLGIQNNCVHVKMQSVKLSYNVTAIHQRTGVTRSDLTRKKGTDILKQFGASIFYFLVKKQKFNFTDKRIYICLITRIQKFCTPKNSNKEVANEPCGHRVKQPLKSKS